MTNRADTYYWTPAEAAEGLRVSLHTVYRLIRDNRISSIQVGGQYRIDRAAITRAAQPPMPNWMEHCRND